MRWALFVEGSEPSAKPTLAEVWDDICKQLSLQPPCAVFPISKKHLLAMDPMNPKMSGAAEGLDALLTRKWQSQSQQGQGVFDAAVILWDLSGIPRSCRRRWTDQTCPIFVPSVIMAGRTRAAGRNQDA